MTKIKSTFLALLAAMLVFLTTSANALIIEISEDPNFVVGAISASDSNGDGMVNLSAGVGGWMFNVVTGFSNPAIGSEHVDIIDLNSVNVSGGAGTIYMRLTHLFSGGADASWVSGVGGTTAGTVSFQSYADASATPFGQATLLSDSGVLPGLSFSTENSGTLVMNGDYSLSIYAAITHVSNGITSFDYTVFVPEPGTLVLFGIGLAAMGLTGRRKKV